MNKKSRIILRACPRCQGDLFPDSDEDDFACLQCGRRFGVAQAVTVPQPATTGVGVAA